MSEMDYREFLLGKMVVADQQGIPVTSDQVHSALQPHQRDAVVWAVNGGRRELREFIKRYQSESAEFHRRVVSGGELVAEYLAKRRAALSRGERD